MHISTTLNALLMGVLAVAWAAPPNILYLMADDMRPQLGCYGHEYMKTPNLDALADKSLLFQYAYTNFAYCAPSRNSFLSGRRPDRTRALNFLHTFREAPGGEEWIAMPQYFKNQGYFTSAAGKIYHDHMDDAKSWSFPSNQTHWIPCQDGDFLDPNGNYCGVTENSAIKITDEDMILDQGLFRMRKAAESGQPWFVGIGVHRPHTHYRVPKGFYGDDLYPHVEYPAHPTPPVDVPFMAPNYQGDDLTDPAGHCPSCLFSKNDTNNYRRWYYASVTYSDYKLGQALKLLDELNQTSNTIIVFHSDHGYGLGELNQWSKKTNTELATHIPLMIHVPWKQSSHGKKTPVKTELIDLYRTLVELSGLGAPVQPTVQGTSVAPAFNVNEPLPEYLANKTAFSQIARCACMRYPPSNEMQCDNNACARVNVTDFTYMGYTMRTNEYRYTAWLKWNGQEADWKEVAGRELYDLRTDPGTNFNYDGYSFNVAEQNPAIVQSLHQQLQKAVEEFR